MTASEEKQMLAKAETMIERSLSAALADGRLSEYGGHAMGDPKLAHDFAQTSCC